MYTIDDIEKVRHGDGRIEIIPCDATVELLALGLDEMGLSLPLIEERDGDAIWDYLEGLDIEIGQVESEGMFAISEYEEQTCRAVDEFNLDDDEYIDYGRLNDRIASVLQKIEDGTFDPLVKIKWRRQRKESDAE